jgi:hypothetical protein
MLVVVLARQSPVSTIAVFGLLEVPRCHQGVDNNDMIYFSYAMSVHLLYTEKPLDITCTPKDNRRD